MRKYPLKHRSVQKAKGFVACALIVCMLILCTIPASAAENTAQPPLEASQEVSVSSSMMGDENTDRPKTVDTQNRTEETGETEEEPSEDPAEPVDPDGSSEPEEPSEPEEVVFTITYDMGIFGKQTEQVEEAGYPQKVPKTEFPAAKFIGWFDSEGKTVNNPALVPVTADVTFTARYERKLEEILETEKHISYIDGYENYMFKPEKGITRAETANIFHKLLIDKNYAPKTFSDVSSGKWYRDQVGIMAALGIVGGYDDGTFKPDKGITRAEFVKMAVCFMGLDQEAAPTFSDVTINHWAYQYIGTAAKMGWIDGYKDGSFKPGDRITRAQAVTIINRMLGRYPPADIKDKKDIKNFYDLYLTHWAYGQIMEAATEHSYEKDAEKKTEVWTDYVKDATVHTSRWINDGEDSYYVDASTGKFVQGKFTINGQEYIFDSTTGKAFTGFMYVGQWNRYFKKGLMVNDISGLGVVSGPYYIKVYKPANYLIIYAKDGDNGYTIPVKAMITSCGYGTPTGTYYTPARYRWLKMVGDTWAQWCTQIQGNYLFHSVPNWTYNNFDLEVHEYNRLGETRSLGCIRLTCADAKWMYDNCALGSKVFISAIETSGPLSKPGSLKLPSWHTWDPTDPTAYWKCQQKGCH